MNLLLNIRFVLSLNFGPSAFGSLNILFITFSLFNSLIHNRTCSPAASVALFEIAMYDPYWVQPSVH